MVHKVLKKSDGTKEEEYRYYIGFLLRKRMKSATEERLLRL